jgi:VIT1/CCC1 family predicted Fe2+/Mn2+ transporter
MPRPLEADHRARVFCPRQPYFEPRAAAVEHSTRAGSDPGQGTAASHRTLTEGQQVPATPVDRLRKLGTVARVRHRGQRAGWLRAAVLGANDGIVSVASVALGVIAAGASTSFVLTAAVAALVAGAMAMAAGEYVSVSSQRDVERADLDQERGELKAHPMAEKQELAAIYVKRGLPVELAGKVAEALTAADALGAHARDELGMAAIMARPVQAALYSALSFTAGAVLPIVAFLLVPTAARTAAVVVSALLALVALGIAGARAGGAPILRAAVRVCVGGGLAMAVTAAVGRLVGGIGA